MLQFTINFSGDNMWILNQNKSYEIFFPFVQGHDSLTLIGFIKDKAIKVKKAILELDYLDGSIYDSDGDGISVILEFNDNGFTVRTMSEDYNYWKNTETCMKKGCLGDVEESFTQLLNNPKNCEYPVIALDEQRQFEEVFLWSTLYAQERFHI